MSNSPVDLYILSIQNGAQAYASTTWAGFKPITEDQTDRIRIAMEQGATPERLPHDLRVQMLRAIFGSSQLTDLGYGRPRDINSTKDLSCAQAMALIDALFGHPEQGLTPQSRMIDEGRWLIRELAARIRSERWQVADAFVAELVHA